MEAPVAMSAIVSFKDLCHGYVYFRVLIIQTLARFVKKYQLLASFKDTVVQKMHVFY